MTLSLENAMPRIRTFLLCLALIAHPALAEDDLTEMNAVSDAWNRYAALSSEDNPESVDLLASSSLQHFAFLRDVALHASPEQMRRLPMMDRIWVYQVRATHDEAALKALDGRGMARLCMAKSWCGVGKPAEGEELIALRHVTVLGDTAVGEFAPPTETQFQFGPELAKEQGQWRVRYESLVPDSSTLIASNARQAGLSDDQLVQNVLAELLAGQALPPMAILDRPFLDDAAARTRLNEFWPKYETTYKARIAAMERKASDGDSFAQMAMGALLYSGALPTVVPKDATRGLELLEQASDGGNAKAASYVIEAMMTGYTPPKNKPLPTDRVAKLALHSGRAAQGGVASVMLGYASFLFNGAGGLGRDCLQAEEWATRAEDAGMPGARNERVWYLATCPIANQRNPQRALALAGHMIENAGTLSASELDTVAAALAANKRYGEAADYQQRAIAKLDPKAAGISGRMQQRLARYRKGNDWVQDYNQYELNVE